MKIHLVPFHGKWLDAMLASLACSEPRLHELVDDPAGADLILFVGNIVPAARGKGIVDNPLPRLYAEKCFQYWDGDHYMPFLPGSYVNAELPRGFDLRRTESQAWIDPPNPAVGYRPEMPKRYLCTFAGGSTSLVRKRLYKIDFARPDVLIRNTSDYYHWDSSQAGREARQQEYADTISASHFGLCPRGAGAASIRFFEVMQAGVAPVLISDRYKLPEGPDWDSFLIRIPESGLKQIPEILEVHRSQSAERGRMARQAWEQWFAPDKVFNQIIAVCVRSKERRRVPERTMQRLWPAMAAYHQMRAAGRKRARSAALAVLRAIGIVPYQINDHEP